jgi:hypothetical protein
MKTKEPQKRDHRTSLLQSLGWELPDISRRQEVHYCSITLLHREQLRDLHVSASVRSPAHCLPRRFPERLLLVFPSAAVVEEVFPCLDRSTSTAAPPAFVVVLLLEPFQVCTYWRVSGLQSIEPGRLARAARWKCPLVSGCYTFSSAFVI